MHHFRCQALASVIGRDMAALNLLDLLDLLDLLILLNLLDINHAATLSPSRPIRTTGF